MRFDKHLPTEKLRPYVSYFVVSENESENEYAVFPSAGLVIGFQYKGRLSTVHNQVENQLDLSGITGISDRYKIFRNSADIGTVLICFTETGFAHFASLPAHELFGLSVPLDGIFRKNDVKEVEEKLASAVTDEQRIHIVEQFLLSQLKDIPSDKLVLEAVRLISRSHGTIRVGELNDRLCISQSPLEKRFRKWVGTTPKKFASVIRFNAVLHHLDETGSLTDICYGNSYFDQAHFIRDFKRFTGKTPQSFRRSE